jgi:predicted secreted hydrolase
MLQGERGFSRKGPSLADASYYYSEPQLRVSGRIVRDGHAKDVRGTAWLDHEWSSQLLAPEAAGWDWIGANLDDGGALMAFRMRRADGSTLWSAATLRHADGSLETAGGDEVAFRAVREWPSPRSGVRYPVAMEVRVRGRTWSIEPLMDDQELDARSSTGTLYWEGAVSLHGASGAGRGYLELTGYGERLRM